MQPIKVGLIGLDHWYSAVPLAKELAGRADAELVGIVDRDLERATAVCGDLGVPITTSPESVIDDPSVDLVASFVSTDENPDICVAAAEAGKHILSIKPMALTVADGTRILDAVRAAGVTFVGSEARGRAAPFNQQLRTWLAEGRIGRMVSASLSMWSGLPTGWPGTSGSGWWVDRDRAPGGGWIDHSIYQIDVLRWLLGAEVTAVSGTVGNLRHPDLAFEDYGHAVLTFDNGVIADVEDTWTAPPGAFWVSSQFVGTEGVVSYDSRAGRVSVRGNFDNFDGWVQLEPSPTYVEALDELFATVRGEGTPLGTVEDAWHNLAACRAFYESAATGKVVAPATLAS